MQVYEKLLSQHHEFIAKQHMFFVATAPLTGDGRVNVSPKGLDSLAVLDDNSVAYIDLGGSGIETHSHLKENGRMTMMFCAFEGLTSILRLYGKGQTLLVGTPGFEELRPLFPEISGAVRGIIKLTFDRVQDSCGSGVPKYQFLEHRNALVTKRSAVTQEQYSAQLTAANAKSIDGLPGITAE
ncbi:MAG: hypothetical protein ACI841_005348 [Planctomycetota bacterium]